MIQIISAQIHKTEACHWATFRSMLEIVEFGYVDLCQAKSILLEKEKRILVVCHSRPL